MSSIVRKAALALIAVICFSVNAAETRLWDTEPLSQISSAHAEAIGALGLPDSLLDSMIFLTDLDGTSQFMTARHFLGLSVASGRFAVMRGEEQEGSVLIRLKVSGQPSADYLFSKDEGDLFLIRLEQNSITYGHFGAAAQIQEEARKSVQVAAPDLMDEQQQRLAREEENERQAAIQRQKEHKEKELEDPEVRAEISRIQQNWARTLSSHIARRWLRPEGLAKDLSAKVRIELRENGEVEAAGLVEGSGSEVFDASIINAIYRASPLPLPDDPRAFVRILQPVFSPSSLQ